MLSESLMTINCMIIITVRSVDNTAPSSEEAIGGPDVANINVTILRKIIRKFVAENRLKSVST